MPQIPVAKENQRMSPGGAGAFQNSSDARMMGDSVATLGKAVSDYAFVIKQKDKQDPVMRTLILQKVASMASAQASQIKNNLEQASIEDMGDKFGDKYDSGMAEHKTEVLKQVPDEFKSYADLAYDNAKFKEQPAIFDVQRKQRTKYENNITDSVFANIYNDVKINPEKLASAEYDAAMLHDSLVQAGKLSPERMADNKRSIGRKLSDSAIDGYVSKPRSELDMGFFGNASQVLEKNKGLYKEDEYQKRVEQIDTAKNTFLTRTWTLTDRAEKEKEKAFTAKQEAEIDNVVIKIQQAQNDPVKLNVYRQELMDKISKGGANYVRPRAFEALKMTGDLREGVMSAEISKDLGDHPSKATAIGIFRRLDYALANGDIDPKTHIYWQNYVRNIMDKNKSDPDYAKKLAAGKAELRAVYKVGNIDNIVDVDSENAKAYLADVAKLESLAVKTGNPDLAMDHVRATFSQKQRAIGAPANYPFSDLTGEPLRDQDSINKAINYTKDAQKNHQIDTGEFRDRMKKLKQAQDRLDAQKRLDSQYWDKFKQGMDSLPGTTQIPLQR